MPAGQPAQNIPRGIPEPKKKPSRPRQKSSKVPVAAPFVPEKKPKALPSVPYSPPPRVPTQKSLWSLALGLGVLLLVLAGSAVAAILLNQPNSNEPVASKSNGKSSAKDEKPTLDLVGNGTNPAEPKFKVNPPTGEAVKNKVVMDSKAAKSNEKSSAEPKIKANPKPAEVAKNKVDVDSKAAKYRALLPPEKQKKVNQAIGKGVKYLLKTQLKDGSWGGKNHPGGYTALPGLALLECGVDRDHPAVQKAAAYLRKKCAEIERISQLVTDLECGPLRNDPNTKKEADNLRKAGAKLLPTYDLSLAILFLDKLGDPQDRKRSKPWHCTSLPVKRIRVVGTTSVRF